MCNYYANSAAIGYGPTRVGMFATGSSGRLSAGAAYYGAMDMGGNLAERTIAVNAAGKNFTGALGDGNISATGFADVASWPSNTTASGVIFKGGDYVSSNAYVRTSDRSLFYSSAEARNYNVGGRGVR
jgi:formylglycine-generating enzyme required for sulfatase activity